MLKAACALVPVVAIVGATHAVSAQTPVFEVASVRPVPPIVALDPRYRPVRALSSGRFDATVNLRALLMWAYAVDGELIEGAFPILDDGFVIAAKAPGPVLLAQPGDVGPMNLMLQSLLADRFKLKVRREVRNRPTYALRRVKDGLLGPGIRPLAVECPAGHPETVTAAPVGCMSKFTIGNTTGVVRRMSDFADALSGIMGRRVIDETAVTGAFEIKTAFNPQSGDGRFPVIVGAGWERLPSIADALRNDLGLKLEPARHDFLAVIVEHIESPTAN
jgi:uncharacterized protein (TIGR03435 family)